MKINLNTKVNVVPNNDTKVTVFELVFPTKKFDKTDYYNLNIMLNIINNYSLKNRDRNSFIENNELHYISNYNLDYSVKGDSMLVYCSFLLPGVGFFDDFNLEKSLKVVKNNLFKAILLDKEESKKIFETDFNRFLSNVNAALANPKNLFNDMWCELYDFKHQVLFSNAEKQKILNTTTNLDRVCELYESLILKADYVSFIGGNVKDKDEYIETFSKVFKPKKEKFSIDVNYYLNYKPDSFGHVDKTVNYTLSAIRVSFHKNIVEEKDRFLFMMLECFLSRKENNHLFNNLRLENNLVYSCLSDAHYKFNTIYFTAYLSKENIAKALEIVDQTLVSFKNKEIFEESKKRLLKADEISFLDRLDDYFYKYKLKKKKVFRKETFEEEYNILKEITYEEFSKFIDDLNKDSELIMIGDKND